MTTIPLEQALKELGRPSSERSVSISDIADALRETHPGEISFPRVALEPRTHQVFFSSLLELARHAAEENDWKVARWLPAMIGMDSNAWLSTRLQNTTFWERPTAYLEVIERMLHITAEWNWRLEILQDSSKPWQTLCEAACVIRPWERIDRDVDERYIDSAASILRYLIANVCPQLDARAYSVDTWFGIPTYPLGFFRYNSMRAFVNAVLRYKHPDVRVESKSNDGNTILLPRHELRIEGNQVSIQHRCGVGPVYTGVWHADGEPDVFGTMNWGGVKLSRQVRNYPEFVGVWLEFWVEWFRAQPDGNFDRYALRTELHKSG